MPREVSFIQVGDLAAGFEQESHLLPMSNTLVNQEYVLNFDNHPPINIYIDSQTTLSFNGKSGVVYRVTEIRTGFYFIDFFLENEAAKTLTIILDTIQSLCTLVFGYLPTEEQARLAPFTRVELDKSLTDVNVDIYFGWINQIPVNNEVKHHFTDELIGYRNQYIYSPTERYEHIYLNEHFYTWHCLDGVEKGLADVDKCHYIKISDGLYLFIWREKIIPTLGVILIDMTALRTDGKIVGYSGTDFKSISNFQVGAIAKVIHVLRDK